MTVRQLLTRAALVTIIALLAAVIGYALTASQAKTYAATAELLFAPRANPLTAIGVGAGPLDQGSAVANDVFDMSSFDISRATARAMADPRYDASTIADDVSVVPVGGDVVEIRALAGSPQDAARIVGTYVQQYVERYRSRQLAATRVARAALVDSLNRLPPSVSDTARGDTLRQQIGELDVFRRTGNTPTVIQGVRAQAGATGPPVTRNTLFGLLFGAVLGVGLVAARTALRPAPRDY